jgi:hypothetical protein
MIGIRGPLQATEAIDTGTETGTTVSLETRRNGYETLGTDLWLATALI